MNTLTEFQQDLIQAIRACFDDLKRSVEGETFYAFALYTDESAMTVVPAANTLEGLQETLGKMGITDEAETPWFKWSVEEWKYVAWRSKDFNELSRKLRTAPERSEFEIFYESLLSDMTVALKQLDEEYYFGNGAERGKIVLFISVSDSNAAFSVENESAKILNPTLLYDAFVNRYNN